MPFLVKLTRWFISVKVFIYRSSNHQANSLRLLVKTLSSEPLTISSWNWEESDISLVDPWKKRVICLTGYPLYCSLSLYDWSVRIDGSGSNRALCASLYLWFCFANSIHIPVCLLMQDSVYSLLRERSGFLLGSKCCVVLATVTWWRT